MVRCFRELKDTYFLDREVGMGSVMTRWGFGFFIVAALSASLLAMSAGPAATSGDEAKKAVAAQEKFPGFVGSIEDLTIQNSHFRKVLFTGNYLQLVVMSLKPGEEIGKEVHHHVDQFFRIDAGEGKLLVGEDGKESYPLRDGDALVVPAGVVHNIVNTSKTAPLQIYTLYSPPNHPAETVHKTKAEAEEADEHEHH
jgi:mannose-6-phosphate isomerase-like protein (cupin superfamily)